MSLTNPIFCRAKPDRFILKAREPARILIAIENKKDISNWPALDRAIQLLRPRSQLGRMFVHMSPYFPFSTRLRLN